ncbi:DNA repair protein rhp41 [Colletotrichum musicola]|uniref:DNA repair protein rhp41 n=1 Tax=Colletotrichum musicola TaxID=2175873 RepID=A0A8H6K1G4_9PEZI|nr:DNA repair protein rhp41 [Colletotrichum musicola]
MAGRKRTRASRSRAVASGVPNVYEEMLAEAAMDIGPATYSERPAKRLKRPGQKGAQIAITETNESDASGDDDEDIEFEDVVLPTPTMQTVQKDSEDEDEDEDEDENGFVFEDIDFGALQPDSEKEEEPKKLTLNLSAHTGAASSVRKGVDRRKPLTKEEKERRLSIHRTHLLCLVLHCSLRNRWCDDEEVQKSLRPLLSKKTTAYLTPGSHLPQFGQTESLKTGIQQAASMFKTKFQITERGLRRSLWAEDPEDLFEYEPASDMDSCIGRTEFRDAATKLRGSRDTGAQLFCAMLRSVGVRARLVCSLQPLAFTAGGPTLPKSRNLKASTKAAKAEQIRTQVSRYSTGDETPSNSDVNKASPLQRLGHPNAAAYQLPSMPTLPPAVSPMAQIPRRIRESPYPVYWVEVLDVAHQRWQPVDPLVTNSMWKPRLMEPPASDKENCMSYVVAFDSNGTARDVTRRYAKAYSAKTRRSRIETAVDNGARWWRKALKPFSQRWPTDLDQIEDNELRAIEGREPMPRNVADFKGHPLFALERHLRRNEVLLPGAQPTGTVSAGAKAKLEKVYRRKDVRVARSRDKWYRMGREVKSLEVPVKFLPRRSNARPGEFVDDGYGGDERDAAGTPVFTEEQTDVYRAPPVFNKQVPKNKFGNIDMFVPSMVPEGGVHIMDESDSTARAAHILGIDYAPALTGFQFNGKHGTAVINGVVVAREYEEAVRAVVGGLGDMEAQAAQTRRSLVARRMWKRFLTALRIRDRVWAGTDSDERAEEQRGGARSGEAILSTPGTVASAGFVTEEVGEGDFTNDTGDKMKRANQSLNDVSSDVTEEYDMEDDGGGGGFLVE